MRKALVVAALMAAAAHAEEARKPATVVFVCEHGAAKSIVAAAHFNRMAEERHLPYRAVARATDPQADFSVAAAEGLRAEGLQPPAGHPAKATKSEIEGAAKVVTFCEIPQALAGQAKVEHWSAPAVGDGYAKAREVIVGNVKALIDTLAPKK